MRFDYDIFISYAHLDNQPLVQDERGWITDFHYVLERRLAMLLGEQPRIWRDRELRGNDYFDDTIADGLVRSALLVSVVTPRYLRSDYCRKELATFTEHSAGGQRLDGSRIFKAVKTPVEITALPSMLQAVLGYEFYELDPERGKTREYSLGPTYREQFIIAIDDLAQEIVDALGAMRDAEARRSTDGDVAADRERDRKTVYLAPASSDMREAHDALRRALRERGHVVLPERELPIVGDDFETFVKEQLARADLSVHILGGRYGFIPEDAAVSSVELQIDLANAAAARNGLERVFWLPLKLEVADERQSALIARVERDEQGLVGATVLRASVEELRRDVVTRLEPPVIEPKAEPPAPVSADDDEPVWIYLLHSEEDREPTDAIEDALYTAGYEVRRPLLDAEDESELREEHEENLRLCDIFLIYYGAGNERWTRKQLADLKRARGLGRDKPIVHKMVLVAEPPTPAKARYRTREAQVLTLASSPVEGGCEALLTALGEKIGAVAP